MRRKLRKEIIVVDETFDALRELLCKTDSEHMLALQKSSFTCIMRGYETQAYHQMGLAHQDCKREGRAGAVAGCVRGPA